MRTPRETKMRPVMSRGRTLLLALILGGLVTAVMLLIAEVTLRVVEYRRRPEGLPLMQENPNGTGSFRLRPGLRIRTTVEGREVLIVTNAYGMPGPPVSKAKPPGIRRLAVLGDSFAFGLWADSAATSFCGQLAADLRDRGVELLNFGVGGYGYDDMELLLEEEVLGFEPDEVMMVTYPGNDIRDTFFGLNKYDVVDGVCVWNRERMAARMGTKARPPGFLFRHSAFYRALFRLRYRAGRAPTAPPGGTSDSLAVSSNMSRASYWSARTYPPRGRAALDISLVTLDRIYRLLTARGIGFSIVAIPYRAQVYVDVEETDTYDIALPQRYIEAFAAARGLPCLDLTPGLRRWVREQRGGTPPELYMLHDPHLNQRGHDRVAQMLERWTESFVGQPQSQ